MADDDSPGFPEAVGGPMGEPAESLEKDDAWLENTNDCIQRFMSTMQQSRYVKNTPVLMSECRYTVDPVRYLVCTVAASKDASKCRSSTGVCVYARVITQLLYNRSSKTWRSLKHGVLTSSLHFTSHRNKLDDTGGDVRPLSTH